MKKDGAIGKQFTKEGAIGTYCLATSLLRNTCDILRPDMSGTAASNFADDARCGYSQSHTMYTHFAAKWADPAVLVFGIETQLHVKCHA